MKHKYNKMKYKRLILSALLLGIGLTGLQAQTMYLQKANGTQTAYAISNVRKMTFSGGGVIVEKTDNSTGVYPLNGLRYLGFTDLLTSVNEQFMQSANACFITYPNPVNELLNIDLTCEASEGTIRILSLEGKVLQIQKTGVQSIVTLNLSQLPEGIYLCSYANEKNIRTVKIIKK